MTGGSGSDIVAFDAYSLDTFKAFEFFLKLGLIILFLVAYYSSDYS